MTKWGVNSMWIKVKKAIEILGTAFVRLVLRFRRFVIYDIPSTLYDWDSTNQTPYLSLPRLMFFLAGNLIIVAYIREHFFGIPFHNFAELIAFFSACSISYVGKKFADSRPYYRTASRYKTTTADADDSEADV